MNRIGPRDVHSRRRNSNPSMPTVSGAKLDSVSAAFGAVVREAVEVLVLPDRVDHVASTR
jgi:hypothetical protein